MVIIKKTTNNKYWQRCGEKEPSYTVDRNVNLSSHYGETVWKSLKKLKIELLAQSSSSLLGIYLEKRKTLIQKIDAPKCSQQYYYNTSTYGSNQVSINR